MANEGDSSYQAYNALGRIEWLEDVKRLAEHLDEPARTKLIGFADKDIAHVIEVETSDKRR